MPNKKQHLKETLAVFEKMKKHAAPYTMKVLGKDIKVLPNVFSPKYFTDGELFVTQIPKLVGKKSFLEIGTGTGIVAMFVYLNGSKNVVATDINPDAVKNAEENFSKYKLDISVRKGDMFNPIKKEEKFDFIFWNHPFNYAPHKPREILLRSGLDYKYEGLKRFFAEGKKYLSPEGKLLLGTGKVARINEIKKLAQENGYKIELINKKVFPMEYGSKIIVDLRIYSLTPNK